MIDSTIVDICDQIKYLSDHGELTADLRLVFRNQIYDILIGIYDSGDYERWIANIEYIILIMMSWELERIVG